MQPFFGFISDKFGLKKRLIWLLVALFLPVGPFFIYVYAPLLVHNFWFWRLAGEGSIWGSSLTPAAE
ncbi:sucrose permease [Klebsiella pneumoniae subsp. rhinoscleromatis]|nr:sucrose permease [Klebsiella pneumoniae subsp. rhinoscleromatis]